MLKSCLLPTLLGRIKVPGLPRLQGDMVRTQSQDILYIYQEVGGEILCKVKRIG